MKKLLISGIATISAGIMVGSSLIFSVVPANAATKVTSISALGGRISPMGCCLPGGGTGTGGTAV